MGVVLLFILDWMQYLSLYRYNLFFLFKQIYRSWPINPDIFYCCGGNVGMLKVPYSQSLRLALTDVLPGHGHSSMSWVSPEVSLGAHRKIASAMHPGCLLTRPVTSGSHRCQQTMVLLWGPPGWLSFWPCLQGRTQTSCGGSTFQPLVSVISFFLSLPGACDRGCA